MKHTVISTAPDGANIEITLEKFDDDDDTGQIRVRQWKPGKNPDRDKPVKDETTKLYDIRATKAGLVCRAAVFLSDPVVRFTVWETSVVQVVSGAVAGNDTTIYEMTLEQVAGLAAFLDVCAFPVAT